MKSISIKRLVIPNLPDRTVVVGLALPNAKGASQIMSVGSVHRPITCRQKPSKLIEQMADKSTLQLQQSQK